MRVEGGGPGVASVGGNGKRQSRVPLVTYKGLLRPREGV